MENKDELTYTKQEIAKNNGVSPDQVARIASSLGINKRRFSASEAATIVRLLQHRGSRTRYVMVRLTQDELENLLKTARAYNMTISNLVRAIPAIIAETENMAKIINIVNGDVQICEQADSIGKMRAYLRKIEKELEKVESPSTLDAWKALSKELRLDTEKQTAR